MRAMRPPSELRATLARAASSAALCWPRKEKGGGERMRRQWYAPGYIHARYEVTHSSMSVPRKAQP